MPMFNFPQFMLTQGRTPRMRGTYAPTGNPMEDLGWEYPGDMSDTKLAAMASPPSIAYADALKLAADPVAPRVEQGDLSMPFAPVNPGRAVTFTTPGGVETARYGADNAFAGGDYRGQAYKTLDDRAAAMDAFNKLQGSRETGITGSPSIEGIMSNQLGGLPMAPEQKRIMALGLQQQYANPLAALERERLQGEYGTREAEARRREYMTAKQSEILGFHMNQFLETNPGATPDQIDSYRNRIARANGIVIPSQIPAAEGPVQQATTGSPAELARQSDLLSILRNAEYNRGSAGAVLERLAELEPSKRAPLIQAMIEAGRSPGAGGTISDFGDAMAKALAYEGSRLGMGTEGLPFQMPDSRTVVLPSGRRLALGYKDRPNIFQGPSFMNPMTEQIKREQARREAARELFNAIYGIK